MPPNEPRTVPPYLNNNQYHWLTSERSSHLSVAEWMGGNWYCVNEVGPVTPEEMHRRGWRWSSRLMSLPVVDDQAPTTNRPSWDRTWMDVVGVMARRGTCVRRQVGAVIVSEDNKLLASGYNGVASGQPHCRGGHQCEAANAPSGMALDGCDAVHAEINGLISCRDIDRARTIYVSVECCIDCVKAMLNTPIQHVVYEQSYAKSGRNLWLKRNQGPLGRLTDPYTWKQLLPGEDRPRD